MPVKPECLILAAGRSRRFGAAKLLHVMPDGRALIQHTLAVYQQVFDRPTVVINPQDLLLAELLEGQRVNVIAAPDAHLGMSQSLIAGLAANSTAQAWMIALADMPKVQVSTLVALVAAADHNHIVVPCYQGQRGNPVVLAAGFIDELSQLQGDVGGKPVVTANADKVVELAVDDPGVLFDIDRPADLKRF